MRGEKLFQSLDKIHHASRNTRQNAPWKITGCIRALRKEVVRMMDRRYTGLQFAGLPREAGSCIGRLTYRNMSLLSVIALTRWRSWGKTPRSDAQWDFAPLSPEFNTILGGFMRLESSLSSFFLLVFGLSPLGLAGKP